MFGGAETVVLLSRLCVIEEEEKTLQESPEDNLMTLDKMKPERGMWGTRDTQTHMWGGFGH